MANIDRPGARLRFLRKQAVRTFARLKSVNPAFARIVNINARDAL
jgi:hypothetical protein